MRLGFLLASIGGGVDHVLAGEVPRSDPAGSPGGKDEDGDVREASEDALQKIKPP
jgi:hypothetical protein